jgi:hypothetical protein
MLHKQNFARNFEATPFLGESFFLMLHKQKFARNFEATPFLGENAYPSIKILMFAQIFAFFPAPKLIATFNSYWLNHDYSLAQIFVFFSSTKVDCNIQ